MELRAAETFLLGPSRLQQKKARSGFLQPENGRHTKLWHLSVIKHKPVLVSVVCNSPQIAMVIVRAICLGEENLGANNRNQVEANWKSFKKITSIQITSTPPSSFRLLADIKIILMVPHVRATPQRGSHRGQRGDAGGRGRYSPRRISPLSRASPSSNRPEDSNHSIYNIVRSAQFHYQRRTNKPFISMLVTVIFSEEDEDEDSMMAPSMDQSPSHLKSTSPNRGNEDNSYAPSSQSKIEEESTRARTEEQAEVFQEIVSMQDKSSVDLASAKATHSQEKAEAQQISPQKLGQHQEPSFPFSTLLYPKLSPGMKLEDIPPGAEITWEPLDEDNGQGSANIK